MGTITKRIVISGYYGFGNSGDEAVLQSILLALEASGKEAGVRFEPVVLSGDPAGTTQAYGVEAVLRNKALGALRGSDGLLSGGGSLLQDATGVTTIPYYLGIIKTAQWLGKPTFVYAQGIGPVGRRMFHPLIRHTFERCRYVSVRDAASAALLADMGVAPDRIDVVADPVLALPLAADAAPTPYARAFGGAATPSPAAWPPAKGFTPIIGVAVRGWREDRADLDALAQGLRGVMRKRRVRVRFLPFHAPGDVEASQRVIDGMQPLAAADFGAVTLAEPSAGPQHMLAQVGACDVLIGTRLHALIYAASQLVPMLGISYDPKIDQFLHQLEMKATTSTAAPDAAAITAETLRLLENRTQWTAQKRALIEQLKTKCQRPAQQIADFYRT